MPVAWGCGGSAMAGQPGFFDEERLEPLSAVGDPVSMVRAGVKIGLANLAYNLTRLAWLNGQALPT